MTLATVSVISVAQNVIFYVSEVINIIYIYNLYTKNFYILISLYVKNAFKMIFIT